MICLRPHHGMCLAYFEGKGYSDGFTVNMQKMLEFFEKGADIELTVSGDEICKECPNLKEGSCVSAGLVEAYDRKVLEACGLSEKAQMRFQEFVENVQKNVQRKLFSRSSEKKCPLFVDGYKECKMGDYIYNRLFCVSEKLPI